MMHSYSLATLCIEGAPVPVIEVGGKYWPLASVAKDLGAGSDGRGLLALFDRWDVSHVKLKAIAAGLRQHGHDGELPAPGEPGDFLTPLRYPAKLIMMGTNYADHVAKDAGIKDFDKTQNAPTLFMKPPTTALVGSGASVPYPTQSREFDWEIELALIIGKRATKVTAAKALDYVAGYTVGLDLSARDWQLNSKNVLKMDLFGGKAFDCSNPLGPRIIPAEFLDASDLQMTLMLNGEVRQHARTSQMIWSIAEQIEAITTHVTLEPGDVIMTGTPSGVGYSTKTFLKVGDRLDAEIEGLGRLVVDIAEAIR